MSTLKDDLTDLAPDAEVAALAEAVAVGRPVISERRAGYVSLRPAPVGAIAIYAHHNRVSIAVDPVQAPAMASSIPGAVADPRTPATTYVIVDVAGLRASFQRVLDAAAQALAWRAAGPALGAGQAQRVRGPAIGEVCPVCQQEKARGNGACECFPEGVA